VFENVRSVSGVVRRALVASVSIAAVTAVTDRPVHAQAQLPELRVTAPSPIVRRPARPVPRAARAAPSAPATPSSAPAGPVQETAPPSDVALPGTLPVVTDQFATVTVVPNEELRRAPGGTLGDVLFSKPGITGSSFAPGAASRPIIRGLDVNRVGIVENGVGAGGASDLGEDHFVPIDPLSTSQIEVIRGPATLRYGSQSIGGVVTATNNRIPDALPCQYAPVPYIGITKAPPPPSRQGCVNFETRGAFTSVDNGREGALLLDAGAGNFAFHADVFGRRASDYRVPSYPYLTPPDPADTPNATQPANFNGRQPNSAMRADGGSVGGSYVFAGGFIGAAVVQNNSLYHIPGAEGENERARIDARQTKVLSKGEYRPDGPVIDAVRYWFGATDYKHNELALADPADLASDGVRQTFTNKEEEGRVEVQFTPFNVRFAWLTTAVGVQAGHQRLTAPSPDDPTSPLNGLFDANKNNRVAGYVFNEFRFTESTKAQLAGRIERVNLNGTVPGFIPDTFDVAADPASIGPAAGRDLNFTPVSGSVGLIQDLPWNLVASITGQYVERAPKPAELFSRGPHEATATFDIGNPNLKIEVAKSIEAGLRRAVGPFRFELTGYYTRFDGFIFRNLTGNTCDEAACIAADDPAGPLELQQARYQQRDAIFRGMEWQSQLDVAPLWGGMFGVENQFDIVRATFTDGSNVPRIPPMRLGGGVFWRDAHWLARVNLLHAFEQDDIAVVGETPTAGYNLLRAEISYTTRLKPVDFGPREVTVGLIGNNLLNEDIRNHVSFTKDVVLMPGIGVRAFANLKF
jgi:iron complex outermembrane receptor protein